MKLYLLETNGQYRTASSDEVIAAGRAVIQRRYRRGTTLASPQSAKAFLQMKLGHLEHEIFAVLWVDARHRIIAFDEMFNGTIDGATVYVREVVKRALRRNAAACVLAHSHPSGVSSPSRADEMLTRRVREALALVDTRILDHIIVAGDTSTSMAELGLL